ncbi:MAG: ABC transporter ATP-binding protein [Gemmatimonadales bacterium]
MSGSRVVAEGLGKWYLRRHEPTRTWRDLFAGRWRAGRAERFWALRDVSFSVEAGSMLGVLGPNGAGKSTLLRLLAGIGRPDEGRLEAGGRLRGLFDLGGGFLGDLTGRENAVLAAVAAGFTRPEAQARLDAITEFAELPDVIDAPLRTYSTGMAVRLAFAVAVHTDPEILLVDEFLSVGDLAFQAKCLARIRALRDGGTAVVLVSHGMGQVRDLCDRAIWLRQGRVVAAGTPDVVAGAYEAAMRAETERRMASAADREVGSTVLRMGENRFGSLEAEIERVEIEPEFLDSGGTLSVALHWRAGGPVKAPIFSVAIRRGDDTTCLETSSEAAGVSLGDLSGSGVVRVTFSRLPLGRGRYFVDVGIYAAEWDHALDHHWNVYSIQIDGPDAQRGAIADRGQWAVTS